MKNIEINMNIISFFVQLQREDIKHFLLLNKGEFVLKTTDEEVLRLDYNSQIYNNLIKIDIERNFFLKKNIGNLKAELLFEIKLDNDLILYPVYCSLEDSKNILLGAFGNKSFKSLTIKQGLINIATTPIDKLNLRASELTVKNGYISINNLEINYVSDKIVYEEIYIEHTNTGDKKTFKLENKENTNTYYLEKNALYEGHWNLNLSLILDGLYVNLPINNVENIFKENPFISIDETFYEINAHRKQKTVLLTVGQPTNNIISTEIKEVQFSENVLFVGFAVEPAKSVKNKINVDLLVLEHRLTKNRILLEIGENCTLQGNYYKINIAIDDTDLLTRDGIWDFIVSFSYDDLTGIKRLSLNSNKSFKNHYYMIPNIGYSKNEVKRLRPYITKDNNLALLVKPGVFKSHIEKINYIANEIEVIGHIEKTEPNFKLEGIILTDGDTNIKGRTLIVEEKNRYVFRIYFNHTQYDVNDLINKNFSYKFLINIRGNLYQEPLLSNMDDMIEKHKSHIYPCLDSDSKGYPLRVTPAFNSNNALELRFSNSLQAIFSRFKSTKSKRRMNLHVISNHNNLNNVQLIFEEIKNGAKYCYEPVAISEKEIEFSLDYKSLNLTEAKYNLSIRYEYNGYSIDAKIKTDDTRLLKKYSTFKSNSNKCKKDYYNSVFFDRKSGILISETRQLFSHEKYSEKVKNIIAKTIAKILTKYVSKSTWLVGENLGEVAQDNGFSFFKYCIDKNVRQTVNYVSKTSNKNWNNIEPYKKNVVKYDSMSHLIKYHMSDYLIVSHGIRDVIPSIFHKSMGSNDKKVIYLQHGIIAMKKLNFNSKSYNGKIKKFIVSSEFERKILLNEMNFKPSQLIVTGLSRFDNLIDKSSYKEKKEILIIPTWRDWLVNTSENFMESDFYKNYHKLLSSEKLNIILNKYNLKIKFYPHIEMQKSHPDAFKINHKNIDVVEIGKESVQELISNSSMLITDYSSVVFDFNYLNKPTAFFQFDLEDYLSNRGSYIDMKNHVFGDTADTVDELLKIIEFNAKNNFNYQLRNRLLSSKFYKYNDKDNSKRIYEEIVKL